MNVETKKIKWGQSFSDILYKSGIDNKIIFDAINKSKNIFNLKTLKRGNEYKLLSYLDKKTPSYFIYEPDLFSGVVYSLEDSIFVDKRIKPIHLKERVVYGNIESSLYETIELRDAVTTTPGTPAGTVIGIARSLNFYHESGTFNNQETIYRTYLSDTQLFTKITLTGSGTWTNGRKE